ncbi:sensor histidine kinase [Phytoactinopolyspora limicola]|uniref:sensor histidine kinase n=1 Tax=Phytoactinopolyspora limicola TaxID=2715536 RepID=UPI0014090D1E|nr:histidine kinase [Phytoactinopolyspora limicola]
MDRLPVWPVGRAGLEARLRLTAYLGVHVLLFVPALVLLAVTLVGWATAPALIGAVLLFAAVPLTQRVANVHRVLGGRILGAEIAAVYRSHSGRGPLGAAWVWLRDRTRWRDVGFLAFSITGGVFISTLAVLPLPAAVSYAVLAVVINGVWWALIPVVLTVWWVCTPLLAQARASADRALLSPSRTEELERRVADVTASRAETLDHSAADLRRIERDLHDGAQARMVSLGIQIGLAKELMSSDPEAAKKLLEEAGDVNRSAIDDLQSLVRGIHPPVLADRGLAGAVEALALQLSLPVTVSVDLTGQPPAPVESAAYFAVAECLANAVKHSGAHRAWVTLAHQDGVLGITVGDDGRGGATMNGGSGLAGVARRLAAFDGTIIIASPSGGPTIVSMEVPCALSSPKTTPSSETA